MSVDYLWRGPFDNDEVNALHAEAFNGALHDDEWNNLVTNHSLGWVTARSSGSLVGFVNVIWDGLVHAWLQDVMVVPASTRQGVGTRLVALARDAARDARCEWLHVDFDADLEPFYFDACGFTPTSAGLIRLDEAQID